MTALWMWEERNQSEWFVSVRILGDVWCWYRINLPWS